VGQHRLGSSENELGRWLLRLLYRPVCYVELDRGYDNSLCGFSSLCVPTAWRTKFCGSEECILGLSAICWVCDADEMVFLHPS
jgi:hypothetical protein